MARVHTTVEVDLEEFDTDELIEEIESRGLRVYDPDDCDGPEPIKNAIYDLYRDWVSLDGKCFEIKLKEFFRDQTNELIL